MSNDPTNQTALMEKIVSLCKRRGFIYQSSEIYGGCGGVWDYGPLGAELKRNLRDAWWTTMTRQREDVLGLDACILMNPSIWKASGHVDTFADLMRECTLTNKRVRADHVDPQDGVVHSYSGAGEKAQWDLIFRAINGEESANDVLKEQAELSARYDELIASGDTWAEQKKVTLENKGYTPQKISILVPPGKPKESADKIALEFYRAQGLKDPVLNYAGAKKVEGSVDFHPETGGALGPARPFNLMLKTYLGPTATEDDITYLRPETAQAIFAQFKNVFDSSRVKVPFGICQIGKAFRNEVTPKNFTFRSREFEQMELEFFIKPDEAVEIICGEVAAWSEGANLEEPQPN
ncbi:MAG: hypothetical protein KDK97_22030, partial [Verrucomicrobiales bacterium]|nr:hypothetical protein [Verrucomicrobiales bacterium]